MSHLVVGPSQLEAEYGLFIFALEENVAFESVAEVYGGCQGGFVADLADEREGCDDEAEVLVW
jgi:hypothetical protein